MQIQSLIIADLESVRVFLEFLIIKVLLLLWIFGLLTSSLLLYLQRFGRYIIQPSSGVSRRTQESTQNPNVPVLLTVTGYKCYGMVSIPWSYHLLLGLNLQPPDDFTQKLFPTKRLILAGHMTH